MEDLSEKRPWILMPAFTADQFLLHMISLGEPEEVTLVGVFGDRGRGSRQDVELPLHRDGEYSARKAAEAGLPFDKQVDIVGLYCIRESSTITSLAWGSESLDINLKQGQALIFDNNLCLHGRKGEVGDRILLRVWVKRR